jgi:holo-[acyl-carrier protein] synthase
MRGAPTDVRVGVDLASVADVTASLARFGERYERRLFTPHERATCAASAERAAGLAARFAAKEAAIKALRLDSAPWRSIEVRRHPGGWCDLALSGEAADAADAAGVVSLAVSMSHEGDLAAAVVVAVTQVHVTDAE